MEHILPRKYNNNFTIALIVALVIAIIAIVYMLWFKEDTKKPVESYETVEPQHPSPPPRAQESTPVKVNGKPALVLFWGSWCGHSNHMKPEWDRAAAILNDGGVIEAMDFETQRDPQVSTEASKTLPEFRGYPDVRFFPNGFDLHGQSIQFSGDRKEENLLKFAYTNMRK